MKLVVYYLIREKKKSIAIVITVVLMVSTMVCMGNLVYGIRNSHSEYEKSINGYYEYSFDVEEAGRKDIMNHVTTKYQIGATQYIDRIEDPVPVKLQACDTNFMKMNHFELIEGKMPSNSNEIIVEKWVLNNLETNQKVGDSIKFGNKEYIICGILKDSFFKSLKEMNVFTTFMNKEKCKFYILFQNKKKLNKQMDKFSEFYKIDKNKISVNWEVLESEEKTLSIDSQNSSFISWLKTIPINEYTVIILWSCLSSFMIYSIYYLSIFKREKDYGILKALGSTRHRLFCITFFEIFILYVFGFIPGYFIGNWVTQRIYKVFLSIFTDSNIPIADFQINLDAIQLGFTITLLLFLITSLFVTRLIFNNQSIDLIKKREKKLLKKRKILSNHNSYIIFNIAARYILLRKEILVLVIISLSLGNIIFFTSQYTLEQIKNQKILEIKSDSGLEADYRLCIENSDLVRGISEEKRELVSKIKGIQKVYASRYTLGAVNLKSEQYPNKKYFNPENKDERLKEMVGGICTEQKNGGYLLRTNLWGYDKKLIDSLKNYLVEGNINYKDIRENEKVIVRLSLSGNGKYDNVNIKPGDVLKFKIPKKEFYGKSNILKFENNCLYETKEVKVAATVKAIPTENVYFIDDSGVDIIMPNDMFVKKTGLKDYNQVEIIKSKDSNINKINKKLLKIVSGINNCSFVNHTSDVEKAKMHYKEQIFILGLISIVIFLIGILYMTNCTRYLIHIQKREIGVLRAIGLSNGGLYSMIGLEACIYSFLTFIVTVVCSVLCEGGTYFILKKVMFFYEVSFKVQWKMIILLGFCSFLLCLIIMQTLAWSILKRKQIETIRNS